MFFHGMLGYPLIRTTWCQPTGTCYKVLSLTKNAAAIGNVYRTTRYHPFPLKIIDFS